MKKKLDLSVDEKEQLINKQLLSNKYILAAVKLLLKAEICGNQSTLLSQTARQDRVWPHETKS